MNDNWSALTSTVIEAAIDVHRELGPGLLESTYKACLRHLLVEKGLTVRTEVGVPVSFRGVNLNCGYRIDLLIEETLVVEVKSVEKLHPIHEAQLLTYLRLAGHPVGLLLNFQVALLKEGIRRMVNDPGFKRRSG